MSINEYENNIVPKLYKTIFILDDNIFYSFDVNSDITFHILKKMVSAASGISNFQIFYNNINYTMYENETLKSLFPFSFEIKFNLIKKNFLSENSSPLIKLKLNKKFCDLHNNKYPYFYCFSCNKSICSDCIFLGNHINHEVMEKYDYLQNSKILVDEIFNDLNINFKENEEKNNDLINELKMKIKSIYMPELNNLINKIENNFNVLIDNFIDNKKEMMNKIKNDTIDLKNICINGLDEIKDQINLEDMMIDEKIFLIFHQKLIEIKKEKEKIKNENNKILNKYNNLSSEINKIYNDIKIFLNTFDKKNLYDKISNEINSNFNSKERKINFSNILSNIQYNKKENLVLKSNEQFIKKKLFNGYNNDLDKNYFFISKEKDKNYNNLTPINNDFKLNISNKNNNNSNENLFDKNDLIFCEPIVKTNNILIYSKINNKIIRQTLSNSKIYNEFPINCSWININNILYVSGGFNSNKFLKYDPFLNKIFLLKNLPNIKYNHSMIYDKNGNIYILGGNDKKIYKYNINLNEFFEINNEILKIRNNPILYIHNDILFVFYGKDKNGYFEKSYEFCELNNLNKNKFKIIYEVKFELENCGIIELDNNSILFIGGKNHNYFLKNAIKFNFINYTMEKSNININEIAIFNENLLQNIGNNEYGNFNMIDSSFMKIQFI